MEKVYCQDCKKWTPNIFLQGPLFSLPDCISPKGIPTVDTPLKRDYSVPEGRWHSYKNRNNDCPEYEWFDRAAEVAAGIERTLKSDHNPRPRQRSLWARIFGGSNA